MSKKVAEGSDDKTFERMPDDRRHECYAVNPAFVPTEWIIFEPDHGYELYSTDAYGEGFVAQVRYCPFCGVLLMTPDVLAGLSPQGARNHGGIVTFP